MTFAPDAYYVFTVDGSTGAPVRGPWAEVLLADLRRRGQSGSFRRVPEPEPVRALRHAYGDTSGRARCGARGMVAQTLAGVTCDECVALLPRGGR